MMKQSFIIISIFLLSGLAAQAQVIKGKVIDATTHEAITGASIHFARHTSGAISSDNGDFTITDPGNADSLIISAVGYENGQVKLNSNANHLLIQLNPSPTNLNELVISASREGESRTEAPIAISTISRQTISETKAITLDQLLNKVSGVYMVDLGNEQHTMSIRQPINYSGVYLYLEDGIPIRAIGDFNHNALIEINEAALKDIEIIRGPSSSLYGSDAVGGAVNFITLSPSAVPTAKIQAEASNYGYRRTDFSVSNTYGKIGFSVAGYYANQHDTYKQHNNFHKLALTFRLDDKISDKTNWTNSLTWIRYYTDQTGGLDSLDFYQKNYSSYYTFTYRKVDAVRFHSVLTRQWNENNRTQFTFYFTHSAVGQNPFYRITAAGNPLKANGQINVDAFHSFGIIAQHKKTFDKINAEWISGINEEYSPASYVANYISIDKNSAGYYVSYTPTDSLLTDYNVRMLNSAVYTQFAINPVTKLRLVGAVRYDRLDDNFMNHLPPSAYSGAPSGKNYFQHLTPKLGLTYNLGKERGLYANYSMGFSPPVITDLYSGVKVPVLKPAYYNSYEAGGWFGFDKSKGSLEADVYRMIGNNEIISVRQPDGSYIMQNAGKTLHYGVEYTLKFAPVEAILFRFSGTNARHKFLIYQENGKSYDHKEMNAAPHMISNVEIAYRPSFLKGFHIDGEWQHLSKYYIDPANTQVYAGYNLFNLRTGYSFHNIELWLNVLNFFNIIYATTIDYASYGNSYRPGIPRTFQFGVTYHFVGNPHKKPNGNNE